MKKILFTLLAMPLLAISFTSCGDDDTKTTWEKYTEWRNENIQYLADKGRIEIDGKAYYQRVVPDWENGIYVLIHYFNDRNLTAGNLVPLSTSIVDVKYKGMLINDIPFDSSYNNKAEYGDSIFRTSLSNVINGWKIALQNMHVGDSCEVLIPYEAGYGISGSGSILPFSTLKFGIKLVDIPFYETRP